MLFWFLLYDLFLRTRMFFLPQYDWSKMRGFFWQLLITNYYTGFWFPNVFDPPYSWFIKLQKYHLKKLNFRILHFGHTGHYLNWWSVQRQMMFVFFFLSTTRWWKSWTSGPYGFLQWRAHYIAVVSARMKMTMQIGHQFHLYQVSCI